MSYIRAQIIRFARNFLLPAVCEALKDFRCIIVSVNVNAFQAIGIERLRQVSMHQINADSLPAIRLKNSSHLNSTWA